VLIENIEKMELSKYFSELKKSQDAAIKAGKHAVVNHKKIVLQGLNIRHDCILNCIYRNYTT
jgi:hypothetical protein